MECRKKATCEALLLVSQSLDKLWRYSGGTDLVLEDNAYCKKDIGIDKSTKDAHRIEHAYDSAKLQGFVGVPALFLDTWDKKKRQDEAE